MRFCPEVCCPSAYQRKLYVIQFLQDFPAFLGDQIIPVFHAILPPMLSENPRHTIPSCSIGQQRGSPMSLFCRSAPYSCLFAAQTGLAGSCFPQTFFLSLLRYPRIYTLRNNPQAFP